MGKHVVEMEVRVTDKGSSTWKKMSNNTNRAKGSTDNYTKSIKKMQSELIRLNTIRDVSTDPIRIKKLNKEIDETERKISKLKGVTSEFGKILPTVTAIGIGKGIYEIGKAAIAASSEMEKYNVTLKTMLGSSSAARDRMSEYLDIAKKTPFEMSQVVSAGNQLQAIGRYSRSNLVMLGDLASATGKPLEQVLGAYAKLSTGQKGIGVDMFRDLLISTKDWMDATGKGIDKNGSLKASTEDMIKVLPKIMDKKGFTGLMSSQAETTEGKISNLKDAIYSLNSALGDRMQPTVKSVTNMLTGMAGSMENIIKIPLTTKIAQEKVELNLLVEQLMDASIKEDARAKVMSELQRQYPEFLKNIKLEKATTEDLKNALIEVNKEYDRKIRLAAIDRQKETLQEKMGGKMDDILKYEQSILANKELKKLAIAQEKMGMHGLMIKANGDVVNMSGELQYSATPQTMEMGAQIDAYRKMTTVFGGDSRRLNRAKAQYNMYKRQMGAIEKMYSGETKDSNATDAGMSASEVDTASGIGTSVGGGSSSGGSGGGGTGRTVNTTIGTLVGKIEIHTTTMTEGAAEIKRLVAQALTEAIPER